MRTDGSSSVRVSNAREPSLVDEFWDVHFYGRKGSKTSLLAKYKYFL